MATRKWHILIKDSSANTVYEAYIRDDNTVETIVWWPTGTKVSDIVAHSVFEVNALQYMGTFNSGSYLFEKVGLGGGGQQ